MARRRHTLLIGALTLLIAALCCTSALALTPDVSWHKSLSAARAAAAASNKPILAIGYRSQHEACQTLIEAILPHPDVIALLDSLELYAVDVDDPASADFCKRYQIGVAGTDDPWLVVQPILPVFLFLDAGGKEYFRDYGIVAPMPNRDHASETEAAAATGFATRLQTILELVSGLRQIDDNPSAQAHALVGHILMEMEQFESATPHLEKAMQLDPKNEQGAFAQAYFDTIILRIVDDPERALRQFDDYAARYADSDRLLEARYYKGVCLIVLERYREAIKILETFETDDQKAPEFDSPWTPMALGLLKELRRAD
jgi:tetratricopeptide (TPR) repeat protein